MYKRQDLERACDEAAVAGQDAAFRAAYGAAMLLSLIHICCASLRRPG